MSERDECLFIGGPKDGERMRIPPERGEVFIPYATPGRDPAAIGNIPKQAYATAVYRREILAGDKGFFSVFVHRDLSIEQALFMLIRNYNPTPPRD